jgi:hypothetical protein
MSAAEGEKNPEGIRDKVQNWLMSEGWQISEQPHPDLAWLIRAEDAGGRRILVGQNRVRPDHIHLKARISISDDHRKKFQSLPEERRRGILYNGASR